MLVVGDLARLPAQARGAVVAIGNFDGVHPGHRLVIDECRAVARQLARPAAVMAFEPHPRAFFQPDQPPFRLTPAPQRTRLLAEAGVDMHFLIPFDRAFAGLSADSFIDDVLCGRLAVAHVVVGYDFRYGKGRLGTPGTLRAAGLARGFGVSIVNEASDEEGGAYASSRVRQALADGDMATAAQGLGRPYEIDGEVVAGARRGRQLGYPTANVEPGEYARPRFGVYAVRVGILADGVATPAPATWHPGVANFGLRPMYALDQPLIEAHLFDFSGDLYGRLVRVQFVAYLRGEMVFDGAAALVAQMDQDSRQARQCLAAAPTAEPSAAVPVTVPVMGDERGDQAPGRR